MAKRSALTKNPSATPVGRDMVYTGGSKDFDEVTGKYRSSGRATPAPTRLSPGVYRDSQGRLVGQGGRPLQQQPQRPPMQQQPPQLGQQGKGPARDVYTPLPQPPMGLKPLQPDYTGGTGDYNRMPSMLGNEAADRDLSFDMGLEESTRRFGLMPNIPSTPGNANQVMLDRLNARAGGMGNGMGQQQPGLEQEARSRAEAIARGDMVTADFKPEREALVNRYLQEMGQRPPGNMGGAIGTGLGNLVAGGVGMGQRPPGMVDPRTMVGPQYDPTSIAFPVNNPSGMGGGKFGLAESIAAQVKARMAGNAAGRMGQNLGNYNMQDMVPYNANRRR